MRILYFKNRGKIISNPFLKMLLIWNKYKNMLSPVVSPLCPVIELETFPKKLKNLECVLRRQQVIRLKDWVERMGSKEQIKKH